jgi:hypothetical protein
VLPHAGHGQADGLAQVLKFSPKGLLIDAYSPQREDRGTDWIDLAADQCTLHYTSEGSSIKAFNICTKAQLPDFANGLSGPCYGHRIRGNAEELVACATLVYRLDNSGGVIKTYCLPGTSVLFALNLDPDNKTFWTADLFDGTVFHVDIATGAINRQFNAVIFRSLAGMAVAGEIAAARSLACPLKIDCSFIENHEGLLPFAYIPLNGGKVRGSSGVTVSMGVDLGPLTPISLGDLTTIFTNDPSNQPTYAALRSVLGQSGHAAFALPKTNYPYQQTKTRYEFQTLTISFQQAQMFFDYAANTKVAALQSLWFRDVPKVSSYPSISDLPTEAQTVLFDLIYVGLFHTKGGGNGTSLASLSALFWSDMTTSNWGTAVADLKALSAFETSNNNSDYAKRFNDDATLLQALLQ